ncbi:hypothetical protein [Labrys neptuniae]
MEARERIGLAALGMIGLVVSVSGFAWHEPAERSVAVEAGMTASSTPKPRLVAQAPAASPAPAPANANVECLRKGFAVTLGDIKLQVPGPPALTLVTGTGVEDEIDFATKAGLEKACAQPEITAKAVVLAFDAMDKAYGPAASWRAQFCEPPKDEATRFLCQGEQRQNGAPRSLASAVFYLPSAFDGESLFQNKAPGLDNFKAWKESLTKAGKPPPVQADGAYDIYPGGIWLERAPKAGAPFLVSCDVEGLEVTGEHNCIGTLDLDGGLRARLEFRTMSAQIGDAAAAASASFRTLLAAWQASASQSSSAPAQPGK